MENLSQKRIILTGGHAGSTAFVVIEEIKRQGKNWDLYWIGPTSALEGQKVATLSLLYFPKYGIKTFEINTGRLQRKFTFHTIPSLLKIPIGFIHAFLLLVKIRPNLILSFGGFSAFPIVVIGWLFRIPVIIHEQTSVVGRSNKYSAFFAKKIAISRSTSREYFPKEKTVFTGNPTPSDITELSSITKFPKLPTIFITGGQSGSVAINNVVEKILPELLSNFRVVHLTGIREEQKFKEIKNKLDSRYIKRYRVYGVVAPSNFNSLFNSSDIVISRAGANTVSKIVVSQKPSILIPIPFSYLDEQKKNAMFAQKIGTVRIIPQDNLTPESLVREISALVTNWKKITTNVSKRENPDIYAAARLIDLIEEEIL